MSQGLVARIERLASTSSPTPAASSSSGDGRLTYEISYSPSPAALADSSRVAALESSIADIEKKLGVLDAASPISDLQTAVSQMQKRLSLLDTNKIDAISRRVHVVMNEVENMLVKKGELVDASDHNLDQKVGELYEFCHRWTSTASSLPAIVLRLQSLQGLHQQSASFVARLQALEQQQDELARLLETTNSAVQELGKSLQDNMTTVRDNMKTLEEKIAKAVKK
jgi:chromosome segregation ATPase